MERKARLIAQFKTGNTTDRTVADLGGDELGNAAAATKVVATGDPRYVEQVSLEDDVKRLDAMARAHSDAKGRNAAERRSVAREVTAVTEQMGELDRALPGLAANSGAPFAMNVGGKTYRERAEAAPGVGGQPAPSFRRRGGRPNKRNQRWHSKSGAHSATVTATTCL